MRLSMRNEIFAFTARKIQREPKKKEGEGEGKRWWWCVLMKLTRPQSSFMLFVSGHVRLAEEYYGILSHRTMGRKEWEMKETPFSSPPTRIFHAIVSLRVTDSKYRESLDRFEKSKTLKLCLKNAFREMSSKMLFRFSKNLTPSRNSQKTKIHLFTSLNMQKISGKLTKFSVIALKQFTILEHGINLA